MEIQGYNLPEDLYYEQNHFWVKPEGDLVVMGLDDFGQKMAGDIVFIQLPPEGKRLKAGKAFAKMESGKWLGKIYAPLDGELIEINEDLELDPTKINEDCYGEGWLYKIRPDNMDDLNNLIHGPQAIEKWVLADIEKYKDKQA
ncbi:MAG: glycine cleavage system protein H [Deltaproteobacteria bacterium]|nr:glycine cleavage system protein H [Deltaproteobacteria bacterium]MBW2153103.1 glycine cleavage system protein H [Deltaproteobacteria bacterium]